MPISDAERGLLQSKMDDEVVASILEKKLWWVKKARAKLEEQRASDLAAWNDLGAAPVAAAVVEPHQIDLEEAIAAATPLGPLGAPIGLEGKALAVWLYDNTSCSFAQIADLAEMSEEDVAIIADGDDPEPEWTSVVLPADQDWSAYDPARPSTVEQFKAQYECEMLPPLVESAAPQADGTVSLMLGIDPGAAGGDMGMAVMRMTPAGPVLEQVGPMVSGGRNMGKTAATQEAMLLAEAHGEIIVRTAPVNRGGRPRLHPAPVQIAEIPDRVLHYCRWFITAKWRVVDVADLFEVDETDLRAALHLY